MTPEIIGPLITGGAGVLGVIAGWLESRRRARKENETSSIHERSEIIKIINEQLVKPLGAELDNVRSRLDDAESEIKGLKKAKSTLIKFVHYLLALIDRHGLSDEIKMAIPEEVDE